MTEKDPLQAAVDEIREVCIKHGVILLGVHDHHCLGHITVLKTPVIPLNLRQELAQRTLNEIDYESGEFIDHPVVEGFGLYKDSDG